MQGRCPIEILRIIHVRALASIRVDNLKLNSAWPSLLCDSVHESFLSTTNISYVNICVHPLSYFTFSPRFCTKTLTLQDRCPYRHLSPIAHPSHSPLGADFFFSSLAKSLASCESRCHRWHLHQSRGRLGARVSRGNQPLGAIIGSVSTYLLLRLMTLVLVIVCRHLPPSAPSIDVPVTSTYVCVFWTLLPPSI